MSDISEAGSNRDPLPPQTTELSWRKLSNDDLTTLVELAAESQLVDGGLVFLNEPQHLRHRYFPNKSGTSIGAFSRDGSLIACSTVHLVGDSDKPMVRIVGQVRLDWRRRGLGSYLMEWSLIQARNIGSASAEQWQLQVSTETLTEPARKLYQSHGFNPTMEELVMTRELGVSLPDQSLPSGVILDNWEPALSQEFFATYESSFRERPGFPGWSMEKWLDWCFEEDDAKPEWSLLARSAGKPAGFLVAGVEESGGFVVQVGVVPEQRRRGIASSLIIEAMNRMKADGITVAILTVNVNNPGAIKTYESLGFQTSGHRGRFERSAP
jgi:mycothiol synthase